MASRTRQHPHYRKRDNLRIPGNAGDVISELKRCFGADSLAPTAVHIEDWATDPLITTPDDLSGPTAHPEVGPNLLRQPYYSGRLWFAGSETAVQSPGLIEGALAAAEDTAERIGLRAR